MKSPPAFPSSRALRLAASVIVAAFGVALFCGWYVQIEHPAYIWDWTGYWTIYKNYGAMIFSGGKWLEQLRREISIADYNPSAILPLMPVYGAFGGGRAIYVMAIGVIYLVPAALCAAAIGRAAKPASAIWRFSFVLALLYPPFWSPTLRGMVDIAGLVPIGLATLLLFRTDYLIKARLGHVLAFGVLLWCAFLFRRWYIFTVIALFFLGLVFALAGVWRAERRVGSLIGGVWRYALAGVTLLACAVLFQWRLLKNIIFTSYHNIYSGYQRPLSTHFTLYYNRLGIFIIALAAIGIAVALWRKEMRILFCVLVAVLSFSLFSRVQAPGIHHSLAVQFFLFPAFLGGGLWLAEHVPGRAGRGLTVALCTLSFLSTFVPVQWGKAQFARAIFPQERYAPLHLDQYAEYRRLTADLDLLPTGPSVAIFASSEVLADSLLEAIQPSLHEKIAGISHVDMRDHFDLSTLQTSEVVIGTPTQLHLPASAQQVVVVPTDLIRSGTGIGAAYSAVGTPYTLDNGVIAQTYRRNRPVSKDEVRALLEQFYRSYPDWRDYYHNNIAVCLASSSISLGDIWGTVKQVAANELFIHPGNRLPTSVRFDLSDDFRPLSVELTIPAEMRRNCPDSDGVAVQIESDGNVLFEHAVVAGQSQVVSLAQAKQFHLSVAPRQNPNCDHLSLRFRF